MDNVIISITKILSMFGVLLFPLMLVLFIFDVLLLNPEKVFSGILIMIISSFVLQVVIEGF